MRLLPPENVRFTKGEIENQIRLQEQYFHSEVLK